jgi:hypothetical protein
MELVKTGKPRDKEGHLSALFQCNNTANLAKTKILDGRKAQPF